MAARPAPWPPPAGPAPAPARRCRVSARPAARPGRRARHHRRQHEGRVPGSPWSCTISEPAARPAPIAAAAGHAPPAPAAARSCRAMRPAIASTASSSNGATPPGWPVSSASASQAAESPGLVAMRARRHSPARAPPRPASDTTKNQAIPAVRRQPQIALNTDHGQRRPTAGQTQATQRSGRARPPHGHRAISLAVSGSSPVARPRRQTARAAPVRARLACWFSSCTCKASRRHRPAAARPAVDR